MTKRYLWTVVSAGLCLGASPTGAIAAKAPDDWVCHNGQGECDKIEIQGSRPKEDYEVRHFVKYATFQLLFDGRDYSAKLTHKEWLVGFKDAKLKWHPVRDNNNNLLLMDDATCAKLQVSAKFAALFVEGRFRAPAYSRFVSDPAIPIHMTDDGQDVQKHDWLIYPIGDTATQDKHSYCLMIPSAESDGGRHDGAVHGEG